MNLAEYSIDEGVTWHTINNAVRVIYRDVNEDDDGMQDLHVTLTNEGVIYDLVDQATGGVTKTLCKVATDIPEDLTS